MQDIYLMNRKTGELQPSEKVIREFYRTHNWHERWTDYWIETSSVVPGTRVEFPDFAKCLN